MAATRLWQSSYEAAKKAAELDGVSAVVWISRVVQEAAKARLAKALAEVRARDITGEIESIKARHAAEIAELAALAGQSEPEPPPGPAPRKARGKKEGGNA